ncbi:GNAT superfamily N-acetyltransferase [Lipingzhangella halophila]|uniref:GNAT superfamily N-acetyltransferase n=1 Tax=Lipingzhangella halophila TaxID=1783352 RepID=A0A7W7RHJ6_9ACTN|nr:GNAT family N-acetyltransferase [Lipingzhangella halophila]MBB4932030.1 GNAT superfamily N-acetyltransferase [Lipingzhangella halophila]
MIATIRSAGWRKGYRGILPDGVLARVRPDPQRWEGLLSEPDPGVRHFIAEIEGLPVGWLCLGPSRDEDTAPGTGEIYACYVHPEYWRHGVGRALVATALHETGNAAPVILWVLTANHAARRFYETMGFALDGEEREPDHPAAAQEVRYLRPAGRPPV